MTKGLKYNVSRYAQVAIGAFLSAIAVNTFLVPHHFLSGGVSGVALMLLYLLNWPVGIMIALMNLPLFLWAYRILDRDFVLIGAFGMAAFSLGLDLTHQLRELHFVDDPMLAAIYGGVVSGVGSGLVFRVENGNAGGTDIPSRIFKKLYSINMGTVSFLINVVIVVVSSFLFGVKPAMLTLISMYISANVLDKTVEGFDYKKVVIVISDHPKEIADAIISEVGRGVTFLHGQGAYTQRQKELVYCVVKITQLARIKQIVGEVDPNAFMTVQDATEVMGKGFQPSI
jgi:uncharacterized membrane-anchored protein YitT (DUF2179 family)